MIFFYTIRHFFHSFIPPLSIGLLFGLFPMLNAQNNKTIYPNIVPNPSFEEVEGYPIGWFYKGKDFEDYLKYWSSPTNASPDAYGKRVFVPANWETKGFGKRTPHTGESMAGITVFGCTEGKPHCREYVQVQLIEPIVPQQPYVCEIWVSPLHNGLRTNNIGVYFSEKPLKITNEERLAVQPQIVETKIIDNKKGTEWVKIRLNFKLNFAASWLIIGNFADDTQTLNISPPLSMRDKMAEYPLNFAYYYLDDISVRKIEPILPLPTAKDDLTRVDLELGKKIRLQNIYFATNSAELLPSSFDELKTLKKILTDNPSLEIEIWGHTDNVGNAAANLTLSKQRAQKVVDFLVTNGIPAQRLGSKGFGDRQPVAPNDIEDNRKRNRRVEFVIVKF